MNKRLFLILPILIDTLFMRFIVNFVFSFQQGLSTAAEVFSFYQGSMTKEEKRKLEAETKKRTKNKFAPRNDENKMRDMVERMEKLFEKKKKASESKASASTRYDETTAVCYSCQQVILLFLINTEFVSKVT